jgi:hypothetical protein
MWLSGRAWHVQGPGSHSQHYQKKKKKRGWGVGGREEEGEEEINQKAGPGLVESSSGGTYLARAKP